jgi:hypothetical protein
MCHHRRRQFLRLGLAQVGIRLVSAWETSDTGAARVPRIGFLAIGTRGNRAFLTRPSGRPQPGRPGVTSMTGFAAFLDRPDSICGAPCSLSRGHLPSKSEQLVGMKGRREKAGVVGPPRYAAASRSVCGVMQTSLSCRRIVVRQQPVTRTEDRKA